MAMKETYKLERDNLFAHQHFPIKQASMTVAKGQTLKRGSLLSATGQLVTSTTTGSGETAVTTVDDVYAVLSEDVDTTSAAKVAPVYLTGEFNERALIVADSAKIADFKASARKVCIFFEKTI